MFRVFPAPAGINRNHDSGRRAGASVPRASGDKPPLRWRQAYRWWCSPRQRG
ncbi:hypothetical protein ACMFG0_18515 [Escherichia coli]